MDTIRLFVIFATAACIVSAQPRGMGALMGSAMDPRVSNSMVPGMGNGQENGKEQMPNLAPGSGSNMGSRLFMMNYLRQQELLLPYMMCQTCLQYSNFVTCMMIEMCSFVN
ncbi:uncharacterized protein LOC132548670 [Ylistrum balloti]|uniref:uncharacterized protein LOC132548670 n=1 Tax=Ylistrum balloti TaxID=509963 RepID=UPI002905E557|nr:uncharacterized protein LOC132548670 [Ylistrum balloti]